MNCPKCGFGQLRDGARFCPNCGNPLPGAPIGEPQVASAVGETPFTTVIDFSDYIAERTCDFTGRKWIFTEIDQWLAAPDASRYFVLTGEPGSGKTAIAARLAQFSLGAVTPPDGLAQLTPGFLSAVHFCSSRDRHWIAPLAFIESLATQLSCCYPAYAEALAEKSGDRQTHIEVAQQVQEVTCGQVIGVVIESLNLSGVSAEDAFIRVVREPLEALFRTGVDREVVILVDGLDEALSWSGEVSIITLLAQAEYLPAGVRFIVTSRPEIRALRPLRRSELEECSLTLGIGLAQSLVDVNQHVLNALATHPQLVDRFTQNLSPVAFAGAVRDKSDGNFLYVRHLLEMLATQKEKVGQESFDKLPDGLDGIYIEFLERLVRESDKAWRERYAPVLGTLAVAQEALTEKQLTSFIGMKQSEVRQVLKSLRQFLDVDESLPASQRNYAIYHRSLADFLLDEDRAEEYWCEMSDQHERIVEYYYAQCGGAWPELVEDDYACHYLATHLAAAERTEALRGLLFNFDWLQAKLRVTSVATLIADYELLPDDEELCLVKNALRLSAHVLAREKTHLAGQLLGRLLSQEALGVQALLEQAKKYSAAPWLRLLTPTLMPPGGPLQRTLTGHVKPVNAVALTPDGHAVSAAGHILKVWDLERGIELHTLRGHTADVTMVAVTSDGQYAISASADETLKVWNLESGEALFTLKGHAGPVTAVAVTLDGQHIITGSDDFYLRVWDLKTGAELCILMGHTGGVTAVAVIPNTRCVISTSRDKTLKIWDLESGTVQHTFEGHEDSVTAVAVTPDGQHAISASRDQTLRVWDLESRTELRTLQGHTDRVNAVAVMPDGKRVISASDDQTLKVWDLASGTELLTLVGHTNRVSSVAAAPDGRRIVSASYDTTLRVWDLEGGAALQVRRGHIAPVNAVAVTPDGRYALSASDDQTLRAWSLEDGAELFVLRGHTERVTAVAVTADSQRAVSAAGSPYGLSSGTLKVWDLERRAEVCTLEGHCEAVRSVAVMPDGRHSLSASRDCTIRLWDLESGEELRNLCGHIFEVAAVAVLPGGQQAIAASWDTLKVWDLETGDELLTLKGHTDYVNAVVTTPDGKRAISASSDTTVREWDLENGTELCTLQSHTKRVNALAITQDGRHLFSVSHDLFLKVWDLESGQVIASFIGESPMLTCAVAPDGMTIVAGEQSGQVHILRLEGVKHQD